LCIGFEVINASVSLYRDCSSSLCWWVLNQISKLLAQEPYTRITASEALSHPFIRQDDSSLPPPRIIVDQVSRPSSRLWQRIICTVFCVMGISWKDRITNLEVRTRTGQQTMDNILRERRLRWLGHVFIWTTSTYHSKHCTGRYQDTREDQADQERTGGT